MPDLLVSLIVPTKNSEKFLDACLRSVQAQTYKNIELIVVDNDSTDKTKEIAQKYTEHVYNHGPERSAQRNYGAKRSTGDYILFVDSDMELTPAVINSCVQKITSDADITGVIIPEESFGEGFWAACKTLERSFYVGVDWMEAARFYRKDAFEKLNGYDEQLISGEDWDLSQRIASVGKLARIDDFIRHNEGKLSLLTSLKKKYYYAKKIRSYSTKEINQTHTRLQSNPLKRYALYFSDIRRLFRNPLLGVGMLIMKTGEFAIGGCGYLFYHLD